MTCPPFSAGGPSTIADALRSVDCMTGQATAAAFGRIFGGDGVLTAALTIGLTLYVALFAIQLLTGRTTLGLSSLTPRMMALGLALTFATSWIAYSQVVWNLLVAGPDWIASSVLGIKGSASQAFAQRLDILFQAVADAAEQAQQAAKDAKGTTPADLLSYAALLLLLGTVGVLVTSRIALAALLALGPIFVILSLFSGARGLFEGWLKTTVMFALVPLFTVLIGVGAVAMLTPVVADLAGGEVDMRQAAIVFVAAAIHCALMAMSLKLVSNLTAGWRLPGFGDGATPRADRPHSPPASVPATTAIPAGTQGQLPQSAQPVPRDDRVRAVVAAVTAPAHADTASDAGARVIHLPGVTARPVAEPLRSGGASTRANDISRGLRTAASSRSIKETLA
ncbi:MAG: type IV secretion system protein [Novosphingobium sp.]